ncbi:hypothetical protein [Agrobacterium vitis]|uniref:hypothetical protein n=1 Tax=Agrobacterium vitis TaxID=373 RepID=UPI001572CBA3|nr:hypothetical protein [Agrobacterium vitis]NSZ17121.1 hypothetical protein [Agrobacterium vitis]QZO02859.1 hypothetical protein K4831_10290 [Agrobacterium vitis]UJL87984.1 hypothetical protein AVF2S5_08630 [Agrobacterium vitis]
MKTASWILTLVLFGLSSCGMVVPEIEEFWGGPVDAAFKVNAIAGQIKCEIGRAVSNILIDDRKLEQKNREYTWLENWGAAVSMQFTINERSGFNPNLNLIRVRSGTENFTGNLSANLSSEATRVDKINTTLYFDELVDPEVRKLTCIPSQTGKGNLFVTSDLKIEQWMRIALLIESTGTGSLSRATKPDAISHEIKFEIITNGSANPAWKLVDISNNIGATQMLEAKRGRIQDLTITMGPTKGSGAKRTLTQPVIDLFQANTLGTGLAAAIANTR